MPGEPRPAVQAMDKIQRALGVRRAFHIHADKVVDAGRVLHQFGAGLVGHGLVHIQAHVGELQTDVGVEALFAHPVEQLVVELGAMPGFIPVGHVFAKIVHAHAQPQAVHGPRGS